MYWFTWAFAQVFGRIPVLILNAAAQGTAIFVFDVLRIRRRLILNNIAIAFPDLSRPKRIQMGRASIKHFTCTLFETIRGGVVSLEDGVTYRNPELMDAVMAENRGAYMVCIHSGNFEVLGAVVSMRWRSATVPVKYVGHGGFDRYVHEQRVRFKIDPVRRSKKGEGFLAIRRALGEGRPVGFMLDQARPGQPKLPLFGKLAKTNTSLAAIWRKLPAPVIPVYCRRHAFGQHEVVFLPEVQLPITDDPEQDVIEHSMTYNKIVEEMIRACPEQYWWIHNRWK